MKKIILPIITIFSFFLLASSASAATPDLPIRDSGFEAKYVSQSVPDPVVLEVGEEKTVVFKFKNVGSATWNSPASRYISAYTVEPKYRESGFAGSGWITNKQTAKISGVVKPGEVGELSLNLKAPNKPGEYVERFFLSAENYSWIKNGYFYIKIKVVPASEKVVNNIKDEEVLENKKNEDSQVMNGSVGGKLVTINKKKVDTVGGEEVKVVVIYKNTGEVDWEGYSLVIDDSSLAGLGKLSFADSSWQTSQLVLKNEKVTEKNSVVRETFYFRAPRKAGKYLATFGLKVDGKVLSDTLYSIDVNVTEDAPTHYKEPQFDGEKTIAITPRLESEPMIRVGLYKPEDDVKFVSEEEDYQIFKADELVGVLPKGETAVLKYHMGQYFFTGGGLEFSSTNYIKLIPLNNKSAVFTLLNYDRKVTWKGPNNFNKYRGDMELRLTNDGNDLYVINELLLEDYTAGIAETSNVSPVEYIKALLTAARTYAYYIMEYSDKHDKRNFDVVAHTGDQLYLGYASEELMPNVVRAAKLTRGFMVTYNKDIVITPYYANSDGKTRSWKQIWGGVEKPWLVPVVAEYDQGRALYGHGVGMSARDAAYRADEEGVDYEYLLKYYYTGVELERVYR